MFSSGSLAFDQPRIDYELDEGEEIRIIGRRHWVELVRMAGVYAVAFLLFGGLALYRSVGGIFLAEGTSQPGLDLVGVLLLIAAAVFGVLWWTSQQGAKQKKKKGQLDLTWVYLVVLALLLIIFWFHYQGGRIFYIDPVYATGLDTINLVLLLIGGAALLAAIYFFIDWRNDFLVVTNTRVIYDDLQLLVRHSLQQVLIDDIQQVNMRADTYPAYWLGYGKIVIRSFSAQPLDFSFAARPKEVAGAINAELAKLRKQEEDDLLRTMIEDRVYGNKPAPKPAPAIHVVSKPGPLPWLFKPNPEIDGETIKWRPHWLFVLIEMARPLGLLLVAIFLAVIAAQVNVAAEWIIGFMAIALLIGIGWLGWIYLEWQDDLYILNRGSIIDVDRKPLGPEDSRRAPLSAIQDVSFDIPFIEQILGFGTVIIKTGGAAGGDFTFNHVPDPRGVQATINDYLTDFKKGERERSLQTTLTLIKAYHQVRNTRQEVIDEVKLAQVINDQLDAQVPRRVDESLQKATSSGASEGSDQLRRTVRKLTRDELLRLLRGKGPRR